MLLILILWGFTEKSDFFRGEGVHKLKVEVGLFPNLSGKGGGERPGKKSGGREGLLPHFERQGACHDITKFEDSQTKGKFRK